MIKKSKQFNPILDNKLSKDIARIEKIKNDLIEEAIGRLSKSKRELLEEATTALKGLKNRLNTNREPVKDLLKTVVDQDGKTLVFNVKNAKKIKATPYKKTREDMSFIMPVKNHDGFYISGKLSGVREYKKLEKFTLHKN
jgi:hypothetical protein